MLGVTNPHLVKWDNYSYHLGKGFLPGDGAAPVKHKGRFLSYNSALLTSFSCLMATGEYHILMVEWHLEAWFPKLQFLVFTLRLS